MRTTLNLDDDLLTAAKGQAAKSGSTLTSVIEDALRMLLARDDPAPARPFKLVTFRGNGLRPGVDLDDSAGLLDIMEEDRWTSGT